MASLKRIQEILTKFTDKGIHPEYSDPHFSLKLDWKNMPDGVDPASGFLKTDRAERKRWQVENFIQLAVSLLEGHNVVVDFCSGSGHLSLPMAYQFPGCHFILVERNRVPLEIGRKRIWDSGLKNVEIYNGYIQDFDEKFDFGVALHACGDATDHAQIKCLENNVPYILCPCDIGYIQNSAFGYPRSSAFSILVNRDEYKALAGAADWTCWDFDSDHGRMGKICMGYINLDRNLAAEEAGYNTHLFTTYPRESTPKNDIICGYKNGKIQIFEKIRLYYSLVTKVDGKRQVDFEKAAQRSIERQSDVHVDITKSF